MVRRRIRFVPLTPAGAVSVIGAAGVPASTKLALAWTMSTAALLWLALVAQVPYGGGLGFVLAAMAFVLVPGLVLWLSARAGEKAGGPLLVLVFLVVLLSDISIRGRALDDTGVDGQSAVKFMLWASGWMLLFWRYSVFKKAFQHSGAGAAALLFALWCLISTAYSPTPFYTFAASVSLIGLWLIGALLVKTVPRGKLVVVIAAALTLGMILTLALYLGVRERSMALTEGGTILRLAGIFSAPNTLGRAAALLLLLVVLAIYYARRVVWLPLAIIGGSTALVCLYMSNSRASMLALVCAVVVVVLRRRPVLLTAAVAVFLSVSAVILAFPSYLQEVKLLVSRTGHISEVSTFTGRTFIWEWVLATAAERPLQGFGFASTRVVMVEGYRGPWGFTTASAHNAWLQSLITVGLVGTVLLLVNNAMLILKFFRRPDRLRDGLFVFVVMLGLFEAAFTGPSVNLITFVWLLATLLPDEDAGTSFAAARSTASPSVTPTQFSRTVTSGAGP